MQSETILEKYQSEEKLTESSIGEVYRGTNLENGQGVVITIFKDDLVDTSDFLSRIKPIASNLRDFRSPFALPLLDYGIYLGRAVVVQGAIEGQRLSQILSESNGLSLDLVLDIAQQVGEYLRDLHQLQVVHGGLNPDTIPLSPKGTIQVLDAGLAQAIDLNKLLELGIIETTPYYSPELRTGGRLTPLSDYFALGAILYEALTGRVFELDLRDSYPGNLVPGLPPELDQLVSKCLARDPEKRIQSSAELFNGIREVHRGMRLGAQDTLLGMEDALIGHTLGAYQLVERLGQGGMATVYKAYEPTLDRYVAIKVLPQFFARDPNFTARFRREARAVAQLSHPNIVPIHSFGEQGAITYIAMQYVTGGTLKQTRGQVYDTELALKLIIPIARALAYAHQRGIIHRDIKPSNVLMSEGEWPLLADFGLAKMAENSGQLTGTGIGVGTPMYMSPEQGQGSGVDQRTDIYSLGIMLYEMVTGDVPFKADTPMAIVIKHISAPMPMPRQVKPDIPEELERVILKATAKNAADRFQTADEMATALEMIASLLTAKRFGIVSSTASRTKTVPDVTRPVADTAAQELETRLNALNSQLKEATRKEDWGAALKICNDALKLAPNNQAWKDHRTKIEAAQRAENFQAQLNDLKSRIDSAIQNKNWDAALIALGESLRLKPGDVEVLAEIEAIQQEQRQHQLASFRHQAEAAATAEKWEAAIEAWEGYLTLEPEDQTEAEAALQKSRQFSQIAADYTAAQKLIRKRRYSQAIELLQEITTKTPDYKESAQLIQKAQSRLEQKPIWQRSWVLPSLGAVAVLLLAVFFGPRLWASVSTAIANRPEINAMESGTTSPDLAVAEPTPTPDPRILNPANQHLYLYSYGHKSWHEARDYCAEKGGYLVTIENAAENEFVYQLTNGSSWLGATDEAGEGIWEWVSGETLEYTNWSDGQPDNSVDGDSSGEDYPAFLWPEDPSYWNDMPAADQQQFVCEWKPADSSYTPIPQGKTMTVTSAENSGAGTLRQALVDAQAGDTITFDPVIFPPDSPTTIFLTSEQLPRISQGSLTLDASNAGVILDGSQLPDDSNFGLVINSDHNTVMGLQIIHTGVGIYLEDGSYNTIGGDRTLGTGPLGQGNLLSDNHIGISLLSMAGGNKITGNMIGSDLSGTKPRGNWAAGIWIEDNQSYHPAPNTIGPDNVIAYNGNSDSVGAGGITGGVVMDTALMPTIITANLIYDNTGPGIRYSQTDAPQDPPAMLDFDLESGTVNGQTCSGCVVEVFSTDTTDGKIYEGAVAANESGDFTFRKGEALTGPYLTATTRSPGEGTSEFSLSTAIQTALDTIQNEAPTYQTSFNTWDFGELPEFASLDTGKLILTGEGDHIGVDLNTVDTNSFAVEFEFRIVESSPDGHCIFYVHDAGIEESQRTLTMGFHVSNQVNLASSEKPDTQEDLAYSSFDVSKTNQVTLIVIGDQIVGFINDQLAYTALDPYGSAVYTHNSFAANYPITCEFDNYKIWDLSGVDFGAQEETRFYEPILTYIRSEASTFEDDFSTSKSEWGRNSDFNSVTSLRQDDKLFFTNEDELTFPINGLLKATDFAVAFDFSPEKTGSETGNLGLSFRSSKNSEAYYKFKLSYSSYALMDSWLFTESDGTDVRTTEIKFVKLHDNDNHILIIVRQKYLAIFVNGELLHEKFDLASWGDDNFFIKSGANGAIAYMDNFQFWNLDGVDFSQKVETTVATSFNESALVYIDSATPPLKMIFQGLKLNGGMTAREALSFLWLKMAHYR